MMHLEVAERDSIERGEKNKEESDSKQGGGFY